MSPTELPLYQVDAFAEQPFSGNPAAICLLEQAAPEAWMQAVAQEMNLSETAFVVPHGDGYGLRWFTRSAEVDLCGHATQATSHLLWETGRAAPEAQLRFHTRSGLLTVAQEDGWIVMDFPSDPPAPAEAPAGLADALGVRPLAVARGRFDYVVEVADEALVRGLTPDLRFLATLPVRGAIVTAPGVPGGPHDFVSRFFAPGAGVDEDPVTGSAHCVLAPYWAATLGERPLRAYQASQRGGGLRVEQAGDRVLLSGRATTVLEEQLLAPAT